MSATASVSKPIVLPLGRIIHGFVAALRGRVPHFVRAYQKRSDAALLAALRGRFGQLIRVYRNRSDAVVLAGLDERDLADIGLTRSDVRDAFAGPVWQDPTSLLRVRALERRLSRNGVSFGLQDPAVVAPPLAPDFTRLPTNRPARFTV